MKTLCQFTLYLTLLYSLTVSAWSGRDHVSMVGSSTVYPFATVAAEQFGKTSRFRAPKVEATGTGGGFKLFCSGIGLSYPDMVNASRHIKASEQADCQQNGVDQIIELKLGYDGIAMAQVHSATPLRLSLQDIFLALASQVPDPKAPEQLMANPYTHWHQVNPTLPDVKIEVLGPPPTSGTRDSFVELAMGGGCQAFPALKALADHDTERYQQLCYHIREDGHFIEAGENDNLIIQKLLVNPDAVGIFGFSFLDQNTDRLRGIPIAGVPPNYYRIAEGQYPITRPLYIYIKQAHVKAIPGMADFLSELTSDKAWGDDGYLADRGLIAMPIQERQRYRATLEQLLH
ncbi:MAG: substrate-binding domain-containing protein [Methylococcales bacterium]|nr:substrate-binding domain-containing protein [Methylococcales bacterium]